MVTRFRLRTMAYAAGLAAVVALTGCGDDAVQAGGPSTEGPASTSTTAVPSTSPTTSTVAVDPVLARIPAAARPETRQGAEAFARFYFEQVNVAFTNAEASALAELSRDECSVCVSFHEAALDLEAKRERHADPSIEVTGATAREFSPSVRSVVVFVVQNSVPVTNASGNVVRRTNKEQGAFLATLEYRDNRWILAKLQVGT